jgi:hypothetical protein
MTLSVFVSHSVGTAENPLVNQLSASLHGAGVPNYLAMYDRQPGVRLSDKVKRHIVESSLLVAVLTKLGQESSWVHDEIGFALGKERRVVAFVEKGLKIDGMHAAAEYVSFDPKAPDADISALSERLARLRAEEEAAAARKALSGMTERAENAEIAALILLVAAVIVIAFLAARK